MQPIVGREAPNKSVRDLCRPRKRLYPLQAMDWLPNLDSLQSKPLSVCHARRPLGLCPLGAFKLKLAWMNNGPFLYGCVAATAREDHRKDENNSDRKEASVESSTWQRIGRKTASAIRHGSQY